MPTTTFASHRARAEFAAVAARAMPISWCLALAFLWCCACSPRAEPVVFGPIATDAVKRLEAQVGPVAPLPPADDEMVARVRSRVRALAGDHSVLRSLSITDAKEWGDAVVPTLTQIVGSPTSEAADRTTAIEMLAAIDTPRSAFALTTHVESHPQTWVRAQCAFHLANTTQDQVIVRLIAAMAGERDEETRRWIGGTLARFGCHEYVTGDPDVVRRWHYGDPERRLSAPAPSPRLQLETWRLVASLANLGDAHTRNATIDVLGRLPPFAADVLASALRDADVNVRRGAAAALEIMGGRAGTAGTMLLESLRGDPPCELEVVAALGAVHHTAAEADVATRVTDAKKSPAMRAAAARALGRLDAAAAIPALTTALAANEPVELRRAAALALLGLGRERDALPVLCALATSASEPEVDAALDAWVAALDKAGTSPAQAFAAEWRALPTPRERAALLSTRWASLAR